MTLFEDAIQNLHLKNLSIHSCSSESEAIDLLMAGNFIRQISETPMNQASTRSHCIFTIALEGRDIVTNAVWNSKLHLVDLAGSERVYKCERNADRSMISRTEAKYINKSLTFLEQVIISLYDQSQGQRVHVPYRNSLMTSILRDSLGGNCRTAMIANLSSNLRDEEETISTGRFALRCQKLTNVVFKNQRQEDTSTLERLQKENLSLREQITQQELFIT